MRTLLYSNVLYCTVLCFKLLCSPQNMFWTSLFSSPCVREKKKKKYIMDETEGVSNVDMTENGDIPQPLPEYF